MDANNKREWEYYKCTIPQWSIEDFKVTQGYKEVFANNLRVNEKSQDHYLKTVEDVKDILSKGPTKENYTRYFHTLLWYEETIQRINLKQYNKIGVKLICTPRGYKLIVPGLAEKRPSVMIGDYVLVLPHKSTKVVVFQGIIGEISEITVTIQGLDTKFEQYYTANNNFDVRFQLCRFSLELMHYAVHIVKDIQQESKTFPTESKKKKKIQPIVNFYNKMVGHNQEQRTAVEHIVSNSSGRAPFLLHGPPGTGKTVTIVEAILQLVKNNKKNRILVCTDSNTAADHLAVCLIKYRSNFNQQKFLLRINSLRRAWETLPECLVPYSNGKCRDTHSSIGLDECKSHNIIITTLAFAGTIARRAKNTDSARYITHLFIDEASQANEPLCMIPICGLLTIRGSLVLAGDPLQLGPVIISNAAKTLGLGTSLMERLQKTFPMYTADSNNGHYTLMLRENFRSSPDILRLPNALFYNGLLNSRAQLDPISNTDILNEGLPSRAITFHGILSEEQKTKASPSFFNDMELEIVQLYISKLVEHHEVRLEDIGVVTPYIRQVSKVKSWLLEQGYDKVEVGTVEAFQGKEKRVIIISTVRANTKMLAHDAKYQLGFLVDDKRFNVALTRAMAKVIIIGNPICLSKDAKWRLYIDLCRKFGTAHGCDYNESQSDD